MTEPHVVSDALYLVFAKKQTREGFLKAVRRHPEIQMGSYPLEVIWDVLNLQRKDLLGKLMPEVAA